MFDDKISTSAIALCLYLQRIINWWWHSRSVLKCDYNLARNKFWSISLWQIAARRVKKRPIFLVNNFICTHTPASSSTVESRHAWLCVLSHSKQVHVKANDIQFRVFFSLSLTHFFNLQVIRLSLKYLLIVHVHIMYRRENNLWFLRLSRHNFSISSLFSFFSVDSVARKKISLFFMGNDRAKSVTTMPLLSWWKWLMMMPYFGL